MKKRKPVLFIDDKQASNQAISLFKQKNIDFVLYNIENFESCCGDLPTTTAPSVFAPEGVFKGIDGIKFYLSLENKNDQSLPSESAFW